MDLPPVVSNLALKLQCWLGVGSVGSGEDRLLVKDVVGPEFWVPA